MPFNLVYKTTNLINGKIYVGKHIQHKTSAFDGYLGSGSLLLEDVKKFGKENFVRETLEMCETEFIAFAREEFWISEFDSRNSLIGYNITKGGEGVDSRTIKNFRNRPDIKEKVSNELKKRWEDPIQREKLTQSIKKSTTPEVIEKRRKSIKEAYEDPLLRELKRKKSIESSNLPEVKRKKSEGMKLYWAKKCSGKIRKKHNKRNKYHYIFKSPNGQLFETFHLASFCKDHDLHDGHMSQVCSGKLRQYKGWICISKTLLTIKTNNL